MGWGVGPRSWQGWVITAVILAGMAVSIRWLGPVIEEATEWPRPVVTLAIAVAWVGMLLGVVALTYADDRKKS